MGPASPRSFKFVHVIEDYLDQRNDVFDNRLAFLQLDLVLQIRPLKANTMEGC